MYTRVQHLRPKGSALPWREGEGEKEEGEEEEGEEERGEEKEEEE